MSLRPFFPVRVLGLPRLWPALPFLLFLLLAAPFGCGGNTSAPPPAAAVQGFVAVNSDITAGEDALLTAVFANGTGEVDQGVGRVQSGVPVSVGPLAQDTTFTLTVKGSSNTVTKTASVRVVPAPIQPVIAVPAILTAGAAGSASVPPQVGCTFTWTLSGGTIQGSASSETLTFTAGTGGYLQLSCIATNSLRKDSRLGQSISTLVAEPQAPVVTAPSHVGAGMTGYKASVPTKDGLAYQWTITGGAIAAGEQSSQVTFSAGPSGSVELSCVTTNAAGTTSIPGTAACAIVTAPSTPTIAVSGAPFKAGDTGSASVAAEPGVVYQWTISGGSFNGASTGSTVSFTAAPKPTLHLTCTARNLFNVSSGTATSDSAITFAKDDVLKALNFDINLGPRKGAKGQILTDSDHPLGTGQSTHNLFRVKEAFSYNDQNKGGVYQYSPVTNPPVKNLLTPEQWAQRGEACAAGWNELMTHKVKHSVTARLSRDDREQVVIAAFPGPPIWWTEPAISNDHFTLFKLNKASNTELSMGARVPLNTPLGTGGSTINTGALYWTNFDPDRQRDWYQKISMAAGDVDGDGLDEILVLVERTLYIIDHDLQTLLPSPPAWTRLGHGGTPVSRFDVCDIDHDGIAEIIQVYGSAEAGDWAEFTISKLDPQKGYFKQLYNNEWIWGDNLYWRSAAVKAADLDGDGKVEIVFSGLKSNSDKVRTLVMGVNTTPGESVNGELLWQVYPIAASPDDDLDSQRWSGWPAGFANAQMRDAAVPNLGVGDLDGDGNLEIAAFDSVLSYKPGKSGTPAVLTYAWDASSNNVLRQGTTGDTSCYGQMAVGKFSGEVNRHDEILIQDFGKLRRFRYNADQLKIVREADVSVDDGIQYFYFLTLADLDDDGTYVKYLGHTLTFTNPIINAVLASPPYWDGLEPAQNMGNAATTIGNSSGESKSIAASVGFSLGYVRGFRAQLPVIANGEIEVRNTLKCSFDFSFETENAYQRDVAYSVYAGSNAVVFSCVPVDVYMYEVTAAGPNSKDAAGNPLTVGTKINVQKMRAPMLQFTDVDYYNAHCGNGPQIDNTVLPQTIGRPHSYPTRGMAKSMVDATQGFLLENAQSGIVPQGNLYNTITYATSLSSGFSFAAELSNELEVTASFVALAGYAVSAHVGLQVNSTVTLGESIQGSVGGLPTKMYVPDYLYKWGIFSHLGTLPDPSVTNGSQSFKVVNYWVE